MSRRITFFALAATAALIATPAYADRECFEDSCRLPEVVEPPQAVGLPNNDDAAPVEANAAAPKPAPQVRVLPQASPLTAAAPAVREPSQSMKSLADQASSPREPVRLAPRFVKELPAVAAAPVREAAAAPIDAARPMRVTSVSSDQAYAPGAVAAPIGPVVVMTPGMLYAGRPPVYLVAPNAKIISIESED